MVAMALTTVLTTQKIGLKNFWMEVLNCLKKVLNWFTLKLQEPWNCFVKGNSSLITFHQLKMPCGKLPDPDYRKLALYPIPVTPEPAGWGWSGTEDHLSSEWMSESSAPEAWWNSLHIAATHSYMQMFMKVIRLTVISGCKCTDSCLNRDVDSDELEQDSVE